MGAFWSANTDNIGPRSAVGALIFVDEELLARLGGWEASVQLTIWAGMSHGTKAICFSSSPAPVDGEPVSGPQTRGKVVMLRQLLDGGFERKKLFVVFDAPGEEVASTLPSGPPSLPSPGALMAVGASSTAVAGRQVIRGTATVLLGVIHDVTMESSFFESSGTRGRRPRDDSGDLPVIESTAWNLMLGVVVRPGLTGAMCPEYT